VHQVGPQIHAGHVRRPRHHAATHYTFAAPDEGFMREPHKIRCRPIRMRLRSWIEWQSAIENPQSKIAFPNASRRTTTTKPTTLSAIRHPLFEFTVLWVTTVFLGLAARTLIQRIFWFGSPRLCLDSVHEFGHATMQRLYGGHPRVTLYGLGGLASCEDATHPMHRS